MVRRSEPRAIGYYEYDERDRVRGSGSGRRSVSRRRVEDVEIREGPRRSYVDERSTSRARY